MEKTYTIQNALVGIDVKSIHAKALISGNDIIIKVEMEENPFKDGDILVSKTGSIFIYNEELSQNSNLYGCYCGIGIYGKFCSYKTINWTYKNDCRHATQQEIDNFLNRIKNEYYKSWNSTKKCLEDIYIPKHGDIVRVDTLYDGNPKNYMVCIMPNKEIPDTYDSNFFDIANVDKKGDLRFLCPYICNAKITLASPKEQEELINALKISNLIWDPYEKKLINTLDNSSSRKKTSVNSSNFKSTTFMPNDGDFLVSRYGSIFICLINDSIHKDKLGCYCALNNSGILYNSKDKAWTYREGCRIATEEEKQKLLNKLKEVRNKTWDSNKKELVDLKWKPEEGMYYYYIATDGSICREQNTSNLDARRIEFNNCFRTNDDAFKYRNHFEEILRNRIIEH